MILAVILPNGGQPPEAVFVDPGASFEALGQHFDGGFTPRAVRAIQLEGWDAVLLYDGSAHTRMLQPDPAGHPVMRNLPAMGLLPVAELRGRRRAVPYGAALVVGPRDNAGQWTSLPPHRVMSLLQPNTFWVEVSARRGWPFNRVSPPTGDAVQAGRWLQEWEAELECESFHRSCTRIVSAYREQDPDLVPDANARWMMHVMFAWWDRWSEPGPSRSGRILRLPRQWVVQARRAKHTRRRLAARRPDCRLARPPEPQGLTGS